MAVAADFLRVEGKRAWRAKLCVSSQTRDAVTATNARPSPINITFGPGPVLVQRPFDATNRFYRGARVP